MMSIPELELELVDLLRAQGLPAVEIRLIGLLGQGSRASAFSVLINGTHHVLKVYDSKESLRAELKNMRKVIPKERLFFWWQERVEGSKLNLAIVEVPEGRSLTAELLTPSTATWLAERLRQLHRIRYRQRVSVTALKEQLLRTGPIFMQHVTAINYRPAECEQLLEYLTEQLDKSSDLYRVHKVRVHGDLNCANIIVATEDVYLIDWESVHRADAAVDIAQLRLDVFFPQNQAMTQFFWSKQSDANLVSPLLSQIIERYHLNHGGDISERLKLYLPLRCLEVLANRYIFGNTELPFDQAANKLVIDQALDLAQNPLAPPPDLSTHGYWDEIQKAVSA
jgi:predicted Ser/Thr protein kinase